MEDRAGGEDCRSAQARPRRTHLDFDDVVQLLERLLRARLRRGRVSTNRMLRMSQAIPSAPSDPSPQTGRTCCRSSWRTLAEMLSASASVFFTATASALTCPTTATTLGLFPNAAKHRAHDELPCRAVRTKSEQPGHAGDEGAAGTANDKLPGPSSPGSLTAAPSPAQRKTSYRALPRPGRSPAAPLSLLIRSTGAPSSLGPLTRRPFLARAAHRPPLFRF